MTGGLRILVSGMIAGDPHQGGATWAVLQYVLGLRMLGHDVYFVEPIAATSLRPSGSDIQRSANAKYFHAVATRFDLLERAALLRQDTRETVGLSYDELLRAARDCDVLINISGMLTNRGLLDVIPCRVYLDLDPAFNQLWHAVEGIDMRFEGHTHFVTVGCAIDHGGMIPTCGVEWIHTFQPIVLEEWPATPGNPAAAWTTVGSWRGYGSIEYGGVLFGQKAHSLRRFMALPGRTDARLRLALSIDPGETKDLELLRANRWTLENPAVVAATPDRYRRFIQRSKGELGIAKSGYVESRCGWFSDRSVCYLASGRPVVAQETGFSRFLPTGEGLCAFSTIDEAVEGLETVERRYEEHCRWAREIAEEHFRAERVLGRLLDTIAVTDESTPDPRERALFDGR